jgi:hypothetical protein
MDDQGGERSMRRRGRISSDSALIELEDDETQDEESMDVGEGSTMDLEED